MQIFRYNEIDSTNTEGKRLIDISAIKQNAAVTAKMQTSGRGRLDRTWQSIEGNLMFSVIVVRDWVKNPNVLPAAACIAARNCISPNYLIKFKWPNDILICQDKPKKCGGILIEVYKNYYIIGIGINVVGNPENTAFTATNLQAYNLHIGNEEAINAELLPMLNFSPEKIIEMWRKQHYFQGREVTINGNRSTFNDVDINFTATVLQDGTPTYISYGDIS